MRLGECIQGQLTISNRRIGGRMAISFSNEHFIHGQMSKYNLNESSMPLYFEKSINLKSLLEPAGLT